jgi:hypothetical protein
MAGSGTHLSDSQRTPAQRGRNYRLTCGLSLFGDPTGRPCRRARSCAHRSPLRRHRGRSWGWGRSGAASPSVATPLGANRALIASTLARRESAKGIIIATGTAGTRHVMSSVVVMRGVFTGVGRVVEVVSRPGDPDNVDRDNLVFSAGTMHIVSTSKPPTFSLNPQTCAYTVSIKQTTRLRGGTRRFRHAAGTFQSTVRLWGVAARDSTGACTQNAASLIDADVLSSRGTLSY